jgi:hypothetical protein
MTLAGSILCPESGTRTEEVYFRKGWADGVYLGAAPLSLMRPGPWQCAALANSTRSAPGPAAARRLPPKVERHGAQAQTLGLASHVGRRVIDERARLWPHPSRADTNAPSVTPLQGFGLRVSVAEWPPMGQGSADQVREAGAGTAEVPVASARSSPCSVATRPRVAARVPMSRATSPLHTSGSQR